uniref:Uncharacterized protein n=1 Tax=Fundulus heteroclitus TaxID=8078 RepID=A0A3Q2Q104_FUNHE
MGQHPLLHGEALLVVAPADAHHTAYLPLISQGVSSHLSGHTLLVEDAFWQPVAGNEMFSCETEKKRQALGSLVATEATSQQRATRDPSLTWLEK